MTAKFHTTLPLLAMLIACILAFPRALTAEETDIHQLLKSFGNKLYALGETTGGSDAEWTKAEQKAMAELTKIAAKFPDTLVAIDKTGATPLIIAAAKGYAPLVELLLGYRSVTDTIDTQDSFGLTAFDHSQLAIRQTKMACIPDLKKDVWSYIPFMVTQPYYYSRTPYEKTSRLLLNKGAVRNETRPKEFWLEHCKGATAIARETVAQSENLQADLLALAQSGEMGFGIREQSKLERMIIGMGEQGNLPPDKVTECLAEIRAQITPSQQLSCLFQ